MAYPSLNIARIMASSSMQKLCLIFLLLFSAFISNAQNRPASKPPAMFIGNFVDDYEITYTINDTLFIQHPKTKYHIIKWDIAGQYIVAKNDVHNPGDGGLYTRIDYMLFSNMEPWKWGFCLTAYNAKSDTAAENTAAANRGNPLKGCNGYPFSRMKRVK